MLLSRLHNTLNKLVTQNIRFKHTLDYTKVPLLREEDLEEQHVRGSGPGGSKASTTSNCVVLKHVHSGIVVKCHEHRFLHKNRKKAREILTAKLDNLINGDNSIEAQVKNIQDKRSSTKDQKREKLKALKDQWKRRETT